MNEIRIELKEGSGKIAAISPYNPDLPKRAKQLGGRWSGSAWVFDARDEDKVRDLYRKIYGTDGSEKCGELVTVRCTVNSDWFEYCQGLFCFGHQVARAVGRDSGAKLADGVIVLQGSIFSAGSRKNWTTRTNIGTVFEMRDIPKAAIDDSGCPSEISYEIVDQSINKDALIAEKEKLIARIAEIDILLNS